MFQYVHHLQKGPLDVMSINFSWSFCKELSEVSVGNLLQKCLVQVCESLFFLERKAMNRRVIIPKLGITNIN